MHPFDTDTRLERTAPFVFNVRITGNWSINNTPNGGYLLGLLAKAMLACSRAKDFPILTANYISRVKLGKAEIILREISHSRSFHRFLASLVQDRQEKVIALGTFAHAGELPSVTRTEATPPEPPPAGSCLRFPEIDGYSLFSNLDVRLAPDTAGWIENRLSERSIQVGWAGFKERREYDIPSLCLMADVFPPPLLATHGMVAWIPTIELTVNIRKIPDSRPLVGIFRSRFLTNGFVEEDGELWDGNGDIVAISRQIAQFKPYS